MAERATAAGRGQGSEERGTKDASAGQVEGGLKESVRSDEYLFMEVGLDTSQLLTLLTPSFRKDGDPAVSMFTRRLDRLARGRRNPVTRVACHAFGFTSFYFSEKGEEDSQM